MQKSACVIWVLVRQLEVATAAAAATTTTALAHLLVTMTIDFCKNNPVLVEICNNETFHIF